MLDFDGYLFSFFLAFLVTTTLAVMSVKHYKTPGTKFFIIIMIFCSLMSIATISEIITTALETKIWWRNIQQLSLFMFPIFIYGFVMDYLELEEMINGKKLGLISMPSIIYLLLIWTDSAHHLMRSSVEIVMIGSHEKTVVDPTTLSYLFILYGAGLTLYSFFVFLLHYENTSSFNKRKYLLLLIGMAVPVFYSVLRPFLPIGLFHSTAISFIPSSVIFYYALVKHQLFSTWPLARDKILEHIKDGIILIDDNKTIIELNSTAVRIFGHSTVKEGVPVSTLYPFFPDLNVFDHIKKETTIQSNWERKYFSILVMTLKQHKKNTTIGYLIIISDITSQKEIEHRLWVRANTDGLTGLANRQFLIEMASEKTQLSRSGSGLSFILLDIDNFKRINDTYGHQTGDEVLVEFSRIISNYLTEKSVAARFGGEEFAILQWDLDKEKCIKNAELICEHIQSTTIFVEKKHSIKITASFGVSYSDHPSVPFQELYKQADQRLYDSKRNGKNQVTYQKIN
ncbi:diguanylate cyclase [Alteribacillus sp. HJP-4]|uniref:histidine kinase N-terminal 7TM domain-containing diguanylate cyclase n=1 Tax=Alteribacillus sp. HJP-4 TaxID=2775394 RepID=UPI0035CCF456